MERIHEINKIQQLVLPQSMSAGATITGLYKELVGAHDVLFHVPFGVLAATKTLTVQVFQADDGSGTNAEEVDAAETIFTSPGGGVTSGQVLISMPLGLFSKPYVTVKLINTAAVAVLGYAEMIVDQRYRGQDVNDQASALTVL